MADKPGQAAPKAAPISRKHAARAITEAVLAAKPATTSETLAGILESLATREFGSVKEAAEAGQKAA